MKFKVIFKNFKSNIKNYVIFYTGNVIGVAVFLLFWGLRSVTRMLFTDSGIEEIAMDIFISAGAVAIFSILLMVYSMLNYIKLRVKDYSLFHILGMKKRLMYALMGLEYLFGWLISLLLGLLIGSIALKGILYGWHALYPEYIVAVKVGSDIYRPVCGISFAIMAAVLFIILVWADNKDVSVLMGGSDKKEKKPQSVYWVLLVFVGIGLLAFGFWQYQGEGWGYIYSHFEWIIGGFLIVTFGGGILLEKLHKRKRFYVRNLLKFNRLYSKYQSSLLVMLMLLSVHFIALSYCVVGISERLPVKGKEEYYPYDAVWMSRDDDQSREYGAELAEKYGGAVKTVPMIRASGYYVEEIGISEETYQQITGKSYGLTGREILIGASEYRSTEGKKIRSDMYSSDLIWLVPGKLTEYWYGYMLPTSNNPMAIKDTKYHYQIRDVFTQNWFGNYRLIYDAENVIVFSNEYFGEQREILLQNPEEATLLQMFTFPEEAKEEAYQELKSYAEQYGVKETGFTSTPQKYLYITEEFVADMEKTDLFIITNKLFLILALFVSGLFVLMIKTMAEIPYYKQRYQFLDCMGIKGRARRKTLSAEVQSTPVIAVVAAAVLSAGYMEMHILTEDFRGVVLGAKVWAYWGILVLGYVLLEYLAQKVFVLYVSRKIKGK